MSGDAFTWVLDERNNVVRFPDHTVCGIWHMEAESAHRLIEGVLAQLEKDGSADVRFHIPAGAVQFAAVKVQRKIRPRIVRAGPDDVSRLTRPAGETPAEEG